MTAAGKSAVDLEALERAVGSWVAGETTLFRRVDATLLVSAIAELRRLRAIHAAALNALARRMDGITDSDTCVDEMVRVICHVAAEEGTET